MHAAARRLGWSVLGLFLVLVLVATSRAQESGVLEGTVVNGTDGGPGIDAGVRVLVRVMQGEDEVDVLETPTESGGRFRFEGLDTSPDLEYWLEATYLDLPNSAGPFIFEADQTSLDVTVPVYETTEDDAAVTLDSVHLIAQSFGQALRVTEIHLFGNSGDKTYIGTGSEAGEGSRQTVFIPLPDNAVGLAFEEGAPTARFVTVAGGVQDSDPVPPGSETSLAFFSYHLMVAGDEVALDRVFAYPVGSLSVLAAQPGLDLRSDQLQAMGPESFQGQQYNFFVTGDLEAGQPLELVLLPTELDPSMGVDPGASGGGQEAAAPAPQGNQNLLRGLGFGLVGLALVGAVAYAAAARYPSAQASRAPNLSTKPEARKLLAELADLEGAHDAGTVDDAEYERQRADIHQALKALWP